MASFYFDVSILKKEWNEQSLMKWGDYIAECFRSEQLYKDGWGTSELSELSDLENDECVINVKWGLDEEGYKQEWSDTITYTKEDWFKEYDKHFPKKINKGEK